MSGGVTERVREGVRDLAQAIADARAEYESARELVAQKHAELVELEQAALALHTQAMRSRRPRVRLSFERVPGGPPGAPVGLLGAGSGPSSNPPDPRPVSARFVVTDR